MLSATTDPLFTRGIGGRTSHSTCRRTPATSRQNGTRNAGPGLPRRVHQLRGGSRGGLAQVAASAAPPLTCTYVSMGARSWGKVGTASRPRPCPTPSSEQVEGEWTVSGGAAEAARRFDDLVVQMEMKLEKV